MYQTDSSKVHALKHSLLHNTSDALQTEEFQLQLQAHQTQNFDCLLLIQINPNHFSSTSVKFNSSSYYRWWKLHNKARDISGWFWRNARLIQFVSDPGLTPGFHKLNPVATYFCSSIKPISMLWNKIFNMSHISPHPRQNIKDSKYVI